MERIDLVLVPGFADWEPALLVAEVRRRSALAVRTVTPDGAPVTSMGGLTVHADAGLSDLSPEGSRLLVLVGSDAWAADEPAHGPVGELVRRYLDAGVLVGAICGATVALARAGVFTDRAHTSNDRGWLDAMAPGYAGREGYDEGSLVVHDRGLVTAPGTASTAFAAELLSALGLFDAETRRVWTALYTTGRFPADADIGAFFAAIRPS